MSIPTSGLGLTDLGVGLGIYNTFSQYLSNLPQDQTIILFPNEVAQREYSEKQGKSSVDFISYFRNNTKFSWARNRSTVGTLGVPVNYTDSNLDSQIMIQAIPLDLEYEIVFWHHNLDTLNTIITNYFFWIFNNPTLTITLQGYPTSLYLNMTDGGSEDMSTTKNMYVVGKYFVYRGLIKAESWIPNIPNLTGSTIKNIVCNVWYKSNGLTEALSLGEVTLP